MRSLRAWRVRRGVKFLDRHLGRDVWLPRVNLGDLSTRGADYCPLAQATESSFWTATATYGLTKSRSTSRRANVQLVMLGFLDAPRESWGSLDDAWRRELVRLRADSERPVNVG